MSWLEIVESQRGQVLASWEDSHGQSSLGLDRCGYACLEKGGNDQVLEKIGIFQPWHGPHNKGDDDLMGVASYEKYINLLVDLGTMNLDMDPSAHRDLLVYEN